MSMKLRQVTLVVKNQEAALDFYTNKVGFEVKTDVTPPGSYRWVTVGPKDQDIEIALFEESIIGSEGWAAYWEPGHNPPMVLRVDDCRKLFDELKSKGVKFKQEKPEEYAWGISATFEDPDGNLFSLSQPPAYSR